MPTQKFRKPTEYDADGAVIVDDGPDIPGVAPESDASLPAAAPATLSVEDVLRVIQATVAASALTPEKIDLLGKTIGLAITNAPINGRPQVVETQSLYKSIFNPFGDLDHPRPVLERAIYWLGYKVTGTTETALELSLLNLLRPGRYAIENATGQPVPVIVKGLDNLPDPQELLVLFPNTDEDQRAALPSMVDMLFQIVSGYVEADTLAGLRTQQAALEMAQRAMRQRRKARPVETSFAV